MIFNIAIDGLLLIVKGLLSIIPDIAWTIDSGAMSTFMGVVSSVCYLLPINTIATILALSIGLKIAQAVIAFIITIWDLLPVV